MMLYGSKAGYLSRSQMSSNCSTTGSSSSRGSTGSRGLNSARKHEVEYSNTDEIRFTVQFNIKNDLLSNSLIISAPDIPEHGNKDFSCHAGVHVLSYITYTP